METTTTVTLYFTKRFTRGLLKGLDHSGSMTFVSVEAAAEWARKVRANKRLDFNLVDASFQNFIR